MYKMHPEKHANQVKITGNFIKKFIKGDLSFEKQQIVDSLQVDMEEMAEGADNENPNSINDLLLPPELFSPEFQLPSINDNDVGIANNATMQQ